MLYRISDPLFKIQSPYTLLIELKEKKGKIQFCVRCVKSLNSSQFLEIKILSSD